MTTWFTSDWHFGHLNILTFGPGRPFATIEEHNQALIDRHNRLVCPDDCVIVLGDVAMGDITESLQHCAAMNGRKYLLCGNHDRPVMCATAKRTAWIDRYKNEGGFTDVKTDHWTTITLPKGLELLASHYPYAGDSGATDRYPDRRPVDRGNWLVHGHVHHGWRVNGRQINVGVDVWDYAPVPAAVIRSLCEQSP